MLKGLFLLHGAGVGGGSLVYANTLMQPKDDIFSLPGWPKSVAWADELKGHFQTAKRMLGVTVNPGLFAGEMALKSVAQKMAAAESYHPTEVGVYFGRSGEISPDPYFSGEGPERTGCTFCGACMVGCRVGAKNTLDKNYLYFAEKFGAKIFPDTKVVKLVPRKLASGEVTYELWTKSPSRLLGTKPQLGFLARRVVLAAGVIGTTSLLLRCREREQTLPQLSPLLGEGVRTNGESLLGATSFDASQDFSQGIAIGAAFHPDSQTKIESVRYPSGSNFMRLLAVPLTGHGSWWLRPLKMLLVLFRQWRAWLKLALVRDWARSSVILLVMQSVDQKLRLKLGRGLRAFFHDGLTCSPEGAGVPSYLPLAQKAATHLAEELQGVAQNIAPEVLLATPASAHILGGCNLADSPQQGVIDPSHQVFGHPGLFVCDGSVIPTNLAVNPSLTITALAERFCSQFPRRSH